MTNESQNLLKQAIKAAGGIRAVADGCNVSYETARRWNKDGYLPWTDSTGKTAHAEKICEMAGGKYKAKKLLELRALAERGAA